jgi:hypothetical protein
MAKVIPGGSSVTRVFPPSLSGGAGDTPPKWVVVQEWDWTTESEHVFVDGVAEAFGGIDWKSNNTSYADTDYPAVSASGLEIRLSSSGSDNRWFSYVQTGPVVSAQLSEIVSGYSESDTISIQCLLDFSLTTAGTNSGYFNGGLFTFDGNVGATGGGIWNYAGNFSNGGADSYITRYGGGPGTGDGNPVYQVVTGNGPASFIDLVLFPGTAWTASMSLDTEFQDPLTVTASVSHGNMEPSESSAITGNPGTSPSFALRPSNRRIGFFTYYQTNASRDSAATFAITKLRVLKRS